MKFSELNIIEPILDALQTEGYEIPSPIQEQSIPVILKGLDILGSAQTGTGKTAAFAIPILQMMNTSNKSGYRMVQALILAPTRELASQIKDSFNSYGKNLKLRISVIFGGVSQKKQVDALRNGVDILIATPGRLLDLIKQKHVNLSYIKYFVLDEADRMLDMGFIHDVNRIVKMIPNKRQTMLFSATMPKEIVHLASAILNNPTRIAVTPVETTLESIKQNLFIVNKKDKTNLLIELLKDKEIVSALVFSRTKHGANKIVKQLTDDHIRCDAIHGNKSQNAREKALANFKSKKSRVLVATDIAARGIDIDELSHVINYDLPEVPETYIHRIGRTGRAGFSGISFSFCSEDEGKLLKDIEKHIKMNILEVKHLYSEKFNGFSKVIKKENKITTGYKPKYKSSKKPYNARANKTSNFKSKPRNSNRAK